jgi:hypothetical protein
VVTAATARAASVEALGVVARLATAAVLLVAAAVLLLAATAAILLPTDVYVPPPFL